MVRFVVALVATGYMLLGATDDPLRTLRKDHPRLIALDSDIARIRGLVQQSPQARRIYAELVKEAERLQSAPPVEYKLVGPRLLGQSRRCLDRVYTLSFLYRFEGRKQYLDRAVRELRAAAGFKDWNPSHFTDTAEMTHAFAIGYDWLYPALSPEDRVWMRRAIVEKGLDQALPVYERQTAWSVSRFSSNLVCNGGIGLGALAVADEEPDKSRVMLHYGIESVPRALASYAPDGGWPEGPAYWHYATRYAATFLAGLESALGTDFGISHIKGFDKTGRFPVYFSSPNGKTFNYSDSHDTLEDAPEMFWLARQFLEPVYAWREQRVLENSGHGDVLDLIWFQPEARSPKQEGWPLDAIFHNVQVAFFRSAWDDANAIFLGVKGGDNKSSHSQLDLGTFVLDAGGVRWAVDLGPDDYNLPGYFGRQRWTYYRMRTESHNTMLIDDENQDLRAEAPIYAHSFSPELAYVDIDLSKAYPRRLKQFRRRIGIAQRQAILIQDVVHANQPVDALWGMVTGAEVVLNGQTAELKKDGWSLSAEILSPRHAVFDVLSTTPPAPQAQNQGTRKLVVRQPEKVTDFELNIILTPHKTGQPKPKTTVRFGRDVA